MHPDDLASRGLSDGERVRIRSRVGQVDVEVRASDAVRVGVFLSEGSDFPKMKEVYTEFFGDAKPARTTIVCKFFADIKVEIDCVAYKPQS